MKKVWIAVCVLAAVIIISISGLVLNVTTAQDLTEMINSACAYVEDEDTDSALDVLEGAIAEFDERTGIMLVFVSHGKLDDIEETLQVAKSFLESGEIPEFMAECNRALAMLKHYKDVEYPYFNNIF